MQGCGFFEYTTVKHVTIGKVSAEDATKIRPNKNFRKFFPEVEIPEEKADFSRSSCLKAGTFIVINKTVKDLGLEQLISQERDPELQQALEDLDDFMIGY